MRQFEILFFDGYNEVRDAKTGDTVFSTILDKDLAKLIDRTRMKEHVVDEVVHLWNKTGKAEDNLWSGGRVDEYLLEEGDCTQDEREVIVESLYKYANS